MQSCFSTLPLTLTPSPLAKIWALIPVFEFNNIRVRNVNFYLANKAIEVSRVDGSLGIDLVEVYSNDDNISGANKSDQLMVGDSIIKLSNYERSIDVTGLNYDNTINAFKQFSDDNTFTLTVQRLQRRKEINTLKIVGPNTEFVGHIWIWC